MITTKVRWYGSEYGPRSRPVKVWKLGAIVLRRKAITRAEAERQERRR